MARKRNRTPTPKQVKALQLHNQGLSWHRAMKEAGYSASTVAQSSRLRKSPTIQAMISSMPAELVNAGLTPQYMALKFKEWIDATKQLSARRNFETDDFIEVPDYETQIKAFDRWEKSMQPVQPNGKGIKRKLTIEEFITGEEQNEA